jgi:lipopolysaccharide export system permease protein
MDSEIIVLKSAGLSRGQLSRPALVIAFIITALSYIISLYIAPLSNVEFKKRIIHYRDNYASILLEDGVFTSRKDLTIYIDEHDNNGNLKGIFVYDNRNKDPITMMAKTGRLIAGKNSTRFELLNGNRQEISKNNQLEILYFDHFIYDLSLAINPDTQHHKEPQEMYLNELFNPGDVSHLNHAKLKAEAHQRLTWPLYNIILTLLALAAAYPKEFNRKGHNKRILKFSLIALIMIAIYFVGNNLISDYSIITPIFYLNVFINILISYRLLFNDKFGKNTKLIPYLSS